MYSAVQQYSTKAQYSTLRILQATVQTKEQTSQVEEADTAQARAEQVMYGEEDDLPAEYWKELAEKRREALEASLIENEELHTSLGLVEDEKAALKEENDELKVQASQAEELAKIVRGLMNEEDSSENEEDVEEEESSSSDE